MGRALGILLILIGILFVLNLPGTDPGATRQAAPQPQTVANDPATNDAAAARLRASVRGASSPPSALMARDETAELRATSHVERGREDKPRREESRRSVPAPQLAPHEGHSESSVPSRARLETPAPAPAPFPAVAPAPVRASAASPAVSSATSRDVARPLDERSHRELARDLQRHLGRAGCYSGPVSGQWDAESRMAMAQFTQNVNAALPVGEPDYVLLALVEKYKGTACGKGEAEADASSARSRSSALAGLAGATGAAIPAVAGARALASHASRPEVPDRTERSAGAATRSPAVRTAALAGPARSEAIAEIPALRPMDKLRALARGEAERAAPGRAPAAAHVPNIATPRTLESVRREISAHRAPRTSGTAMAAAGPTSPKEHAAQAAAPQAPAQDIADAALTTVAGKGGGAASHTASRPVAKLAEKVVAAPEEGAPDAKVPAKGFKKTERASSGDDATRRTGSKAQRASKPAATDEDEEPKAKTAQKAPPAGTQPAKAAQRPKAPAQPAPVRVAQRYVPPAYVGGNVVRLMPPTVAYAPARTFFRPQNFWESMRRGGL